MKLIDISVKRLIIYFFFDETGVVDEYVSFMLNSLSALSNEILIVSNGFLNYDGKVCLEKYGTLLQRPNQGYDVWAYKTALEYIGWEKLASFDETVLMNSTIMGPVFPFSDMFSTMDQKDLDFWGITKSFESNDNFISCEYGYIPEHIQSHFICCRRTLIESETFQLYWKNMPPIKAYEDSIGKHEVIFTKKMSDAGFCWDIYVKMDWLKVYSDNPILMCPMKLVYDEKCPIIKRRSFFQDPGSFLNHNSGESSERLFKFIEHQTDYPVDLIWNTILRKYHHSDIVKNLNLAYILPLHFNIAGSKILDDSISKKVIVFHLYFPDVFPDILKYVKAIPDDFDFYLTTDTSSKRVEIEKKLFENNIAFTEIRVIPNRGRDVSSLLVGVKDIIMNYDLVCFAHDKKAVQVHPGTVGESFAYKCYENILGSEAFIQNVVSTFIQHPRLGLLSPPEPNHGVYFQTIGGEWGNNYDSTRQLKANLKLDVPMDIEKPPIAPFGSVFWFRPIALKALFDAEWNYEDFPEEPMKEDGTISHAIERIYPFVVQAAGYYPGVLMNDEAAALEYCNLRYYVRKYNEQLIRRGWGGSLEFMLCVLGKLASGKMVLNIRNISANLVAKCKRRIKKYIGRILNV